MTDDALFLWAALPNAADRFWAKVRKTDNCWEWVGAKSSKRYGTLGFGPRGARKSLRAHRLSFVLHNGPIPDGKEICHRCDNPQCVRPDHLFAGTRAENMQDAKAKGRLVVPNKGKLQTHCRRGHALTPENTKVHPDGRRQCATCRTAWGRHRNFVESVANKVRHSHAPLYRGEAGR